MFKILGLAALSPAGFAIAVAGLTLNDIHAKEMRISGVRAVAWRVGVGSVVLAGERMAAKTAPWPSVGAARAGLRVTGGTPES